MTTIDSLKNIVTNNNTIVDENIIDLILANTTAKYTQSNSIVCAKEGQVIAVQGGQQNRVDCIKLAKRKIYNWYLRQYPKCINLINLFKNEVKKQDRINAIIKYIEGDFSKIEYENWVSLFMTIPEPLGEQEKRLFIQTLTNVSLASDAFFPFRDNIDEANKCGVKYIVQPGGSIADEEIIKACNEYNIAMCLTGNEMRMFLH